MSERARAQGILRQAKETLIQRLTEYVLDHEEEILADARGDSYMGDIDTLYDQVGMRLSHVTQMLANLPPEVDPTGGPNSANTAHGFPSHHVDDTFTVATEPSPSADAFVADTTPALPGPVFVATAALPAPRAKETDEEHLAPVSFVLFVTEIRQGDLPAAGRTLARLFEVDGTRGFRCASFFAERMERDANFLGRAMQLRTELQSEGHNGPLMLLYECFGLTGIESVAVLQALRRRME